MLGMEHDRADLLLPGQMARMLRVPVKWLVNEARAGRIPCLNAGGRFLFHPNTIKKLLAERAAQGEVSHAA